MKYPNKKNEIAIDMLYTKTSVVFPHVLVTMDVSSADALEDMTKAMNEKTEIFMVSQRSSAENGVKDESDVCRIGTIVRVRAITKSKQGALATVELEGISRASVVRFATINGDETTIVKPEPSIMPSPEKNELIINDLKTIIDMYSAGLPSLKALTDELFEVLKAFSNPGILIDKIASALLMKFEDRQDILEEVDVFRRYELLMYKLTREFEILKKDVNLHKKVKASIDSNQRDYYLREQLKVIKAELGEQDEGDETYAEYADAIISNENLSPEIAEKLLKEAKKLLRLPYGAAERTVVANYLDTCLEIPWGEKSRDRSDVRSAERVLNRDHYGLEKVKERILEYLSVLTLNPSIKSQIICLVGAPGVGKTSVASSVARAMKRSFVRIALGGVRDEAEIRGHRKTYIGAMPGRIVNAICEAGTMNPVILFDEIDKMGSDYRGDPSSAMLEVLDPDQNKSFRDHFVEMPLDLSDCLFICTANTTATIPKPLLDRMEIIELHSYTREEKFEIAKHYLIPKETERHGLTRKMLTFKSDAIYEIIDRYTLEAGVRNLSRQLAAICRKAAKAVVEAQTDKKEPEPIKLKASDIVKYLGARIHDPDMMEKKDAVGVVNGLAYTEAGGEMLKVEGTLMPGSGKLELTGSLGEVMKESAKIAYSIVRARAEKLGLDPEFYKKNDIHIHFPEGAVPKDGPSAGVTLVTALVSVIGGIEVRHDVAMTGEVTLSGRTIAIGGLREKTVAARRAGIKRVLVPFDNRQDVDKLDEYLKEGMDFTFCKNIDEVLSYALSK